jgi:signal transduction histidine kinase
MPHPHHRLRTTRLTFAWPLKDMTLSLVTDALERAARCGHVDAETAELIRLTAPGRGRVARLALAVTDLLDVLARTREHERAATSSAVQSLREPVTSIRAQVQVLCQIPDLTPSARAALLSDMDDEVARLSAELDALAAVVRRWTRSDREGLRQEPQRGEAELITKASEVSSDRARGRVVLTPSLPSPTTPVP